MAITYVHPGEPNQEADLLCSILDLLAISYVAYNPGFFIGDPSEENRVAYLLTRLLDGLGGGSGGGAFWDLNGNNTSTTKSLGTTSNQNFQIITNNTAIGIFTTTGRFGLGTATPSTRLELRDVSFTSTLPLGGTGVAITLNNQTTTPIIAGIYNSTYNSSYIDLIPDSRNNNIGLRVILYNDFEVATQSIYFQAYSGNDGWAVYENGNVNGLGTVLATENFSTSPVILAPGHTRVLTAFSTGQVGIGISTTPSGRLHVVGSGTTSADNALYVQNSDNSSYFQFRNDGALKISSLAGSGSEIITVGNDGTIGSSSFTAKGDIIVYDGTNVTKFAAGANDTLLAYDSATATGLKTISTGTTAGTICTGNDSRLPRMITRAGDQALSAGNLAWTGSVVPSGAADLRYRWNRVDDLVTVHFRFEYASGGTAVTKLLVTWPSDMPLPDSITGAGNGEFVFVAMGNIITNFGSDTGIKASTCTIELDGSGNYRINLQPNASQSAIGAMMTLQYISVTS